MSERPIERTYAHARHSWWPGWIWAVPIAAVLVGGWLGVRALARGGETVTVSLTWPTGYPMHSTHGSRSNSASARAR